MKEEFNRIHNKLDRIDNKLDNHLSRLSKAEEAIIWIRGHLKITTAFGLAAFSAAAAWFLNNFK